MLAVLCEGTCHSAGYLTHLGQWKHTQYAKQTQTEITKYVVTSENKTFLQIKCLAFRDLKEDIKSVWWSYSCWPHRSVMRLLFLTKLCQKYNVHVDHFLIYPLSSLHSTLQFLRGTVQWHWFLLLKIPVNAPSYSSLTSEERALLEVSLGKRLYCT